MRSPERIWVTGVEETGWWHDVRTQVIRQSVSLTATRGPRHGSDLSVDNVGRRVCVRPRQRGGWMMALLACPLSDEACDEPLAMRA